MSDLFDEIIEEILSRLPAKSVVRFNLVCKQWRSLISHPNFVKKHLNQVLVDQPNNHHKLIVNSVPDFYSVDYYKSTKRDFPLQSPHGPRILGSCNGLLLIGSCDQNCRYDTLVLWNPLFRHYNMLPQCSSISGYVRLIGFGYDSSIDDYKVVRVITNSRYSKSMRDVEQKVEVYTLKTNSWRKIQGIPYGNVSISLHRIKGTVVNGSIYWVVTYADNKENFETFILAFDLIDENFRLVGAPHADDPQHAWERSLVEVRGRLGLYQTQYDLLGVMIWILKEDKHKNECWAKLMTIPKDCEICTECAYFMKNDEVLLIIRSTKSWKEDMKLVVYNPGNMTFRNLPAYGISYWYEDIIYVETLVSPLGG